jgi:hypothetical protein
VRGRGWGLDEGVAVPCSTALDKGVPTGFFLNQRLKLIDTNLLEYIKISLEKSGKCHYTTGLSNSFQEKMNNNFRRCKSS